MTDKRHTFPVAKGHLYQSLHEFRDILREEYKKKWNRVLPFCEEVFDRWEKAQYLKFGKETSVYDSSLVFGDVNVGDHTWIGPFTILDGTGGLEIGNYCTISAGVQIYTHDNVEWTLTGGETPFEYQPVKIGDRCYIGPNAVITKGVTIGDGSIIGAQSLVSKDIPAGSRAWGCPAKTVSSPHIGK